MAAQPTLELGSRLGGYRVEQRLGRGGMGLVFLAEHERLGRKAALKLLIPELARDESFRERFVHESRLIAAIEHPNIIPIYDADEVDGLLFVAMRYVEGHDLKALIARDGPLPAERTLEIVGSAGAALDAAHARELVHRDVKPANILLDEPSGRIFLTDFGIAKHAKSPDTEAGTFIGTVGYTPPEQIEGRAISPATDVYALGCVLYECLAGAPPFDKETDVAVVFAHLTDPPPAVTAKRSDLPVALDAVVAIALAKSEAQRYQTCGELLAATRDALKGATVIVSPRTETAPAFALPASPPRAAVRTNLPTPDSPLVGRAQEVDEAVALLRRADVRLLTFTGPGGTGKTRLAVEVGASVAEEYAHGVVFVALAAINDPALVVASVAEAVGVEERGAGEDALFEALCAELRGEQLLLILDNFEHLLPAAPRVAELLAAVPSLEILVTSRAALRLRNEEEYPIRPLALPDPAAPLDLDALAASPAVELFIERARAVRPAFALDEANALHVVEICVRLDGLPLALELAAARVKLLAPQAILSRLENRLQLLTGGARDLPSRHQTLRGTIDWSYELLDPSAQLLLARLAVFVGFTLDAAEAVCATEDGLEPVAIVDALSSLVDENLVRQRESPDGDVRFDLLETIREYALFRLVERREVDDLRQRHATWFLDLAEAAEPELVGPDQATWVVRLQEEAGNLRAALTWSLDGGELETGLRMAGVLFRFWSIRGELSEGRRWLEQALQRDADIAPAVRAKALFAAGYTALGQGDFAEAIRHFEASLELARQLRDDVAIAGCLVQLGWLRLAQGESERAVALSEEGLESARRLGDNRTSSLALANLGDAAFAGGDSAGAAQLYEEALALRRDVGDRRIVADALLKLGRAQTVAGDPERATASLEEGLELARAIDDGWTTSVALASLAAVALTRNDGAKADELLREALTWAGKRGDKRLAAECLGGMGSVAADRGAHARAARLWGAAEAVRESTGASVSPVEQQLLEGRQAAVREALGKTTLQADWEAGRRLGLEGATAEALASGSS